MKPSFRLVALISLPAAALVLGCSSSQPSQPYSADRGNTPPPPAAMAQSTATRPAPPSSGRPPGWSAPVWRGPVPGSSVSGSTAVVPSPSTRYTAPTPPTAYPSAPSAPSGAPSYAFSWVGSLRDAQDAARRDGKLIFIEAGRDACRNCEYLRKEVIPSADVNSQLGSMSVGCYDDVDKTPYSDAFNILQTNVVGAGALPLCGWVTPDLRWVHGFWGRKDNAKFLAEISIARSAYQRMADAARPPSSLELGRLPAAGSLPDAELADVSAELADDKMIDVAPTPAIVAPTDRPVLATATPTSLPTPIPAPASVIETPTAPPIADVTPTAGNAPVFASVAPSSIPSPTFGVEPPPAEISDEDASRAWVRDELKRAASELASHRYAEARTILASVRVKAKGMPESREADKGEVAIYNLRKIAKAGGSPEADKLRAAAQRDLKDTVWSSLFA